MKPNRQAKILELIESKDIETQEQLLQELEACGFATTQSTITRDNPELRIIKELGTVIERGGDIDAFASQTPVVQIVRESDLFTYYKYLSKNDTLQDILDAFEENKKLLAVLVSENGREGERVENIVTPADLVQVNKILEDYR